MIEARLQKIGDDFVVVIPDEEVKRRGWQEGQFIALDVADPKNAASLPADLEAIVDERWERNLPALRYLEDR